MVMNRRLATAILTFTLLSPFLYFVTCSVGAESAGSVHNLNTGLSYTSIQDAIDAGETLGGHTIFVDAGTCNENIVVNKQIRLIGEHPDSTVINAETGRKMP